MANPIEVCSNVNGRLKYNLSGPIGVSSGPEYVRMPVPSLYVQSLEPLNSASSCPIRLNAIPQLLAIVVADISASRVI